MPPQDPFNQPKVPTPGASQPQHPGQPVTSSPYDFIMSPGSPGNLPKPKLKPSGRKLPLIIGAGIIIVIVVFVVFSSLNKNSTAPTFLKIAQQQTEIVRVAQLNDNDLNDSTVKNFVINTNLSVGSDKTEFVKFLADNGVKLDAKKFADTNDPKTDKALTAAKENGTLDSSTRTTLVAELRAYQSTLQTAYKETPGKAGRAEIKKLFDNAALLIQQSESSN